MRKKTNERGNTLIAVIIALPLIFTAFGMGFDLMSYLWVRGNVERNVEVSVAAGAGTAFTNTAGNLRLDSDAVRTATYRGYEANRGETPFLACQPGPRCWEMPDGRPQVTTDADRQEITVSWTVEEQMRTNWLRIVGITQFTITAQSSATLTVPTS